MAPPCNERVQYIWVFFTVLSIILSLVGIYQKDILAKFILGIKPCEDDEGCKQVNSIGLAIGLLIVISANIGLWIGVKKVYMYTLDGWIREGRSDKETPGGEQAGAQAGEQAGAQAKAQTGAQTGAQIGAQTGAQGIQETQGAQDASCAMKTESIKSVLLHALKMI